MPAVIFMQINLLFKANCIGITMIITFLRGVSLYKHNSPRSKRHPCASWLFQSTCHAAFYYRHPALDAGSKHHRHMGSCLHKNDSDELC